jgi:hypothetical protein
MTTRNGKIARLPQKIRDLLNQRLDDGEPGGPLVEWLNALPPVQAVLAAEFRGSRINEQNLSKWRGGGYQDWQKQQQRRNLVRQLTEEAGELSADAGGVEFSHHWSTVLTAELAESARDLLATITDPAERCARQQEFLKTLERVRRQDYRAGRLAIERECRERERVKEQEKDEYRRECAKEDAPLLRGMKLSSMMNDYAKPDFLSQMMATGSAESLLRNAEPDQTESN